MGSLFAGHSFKKISMRPVLPVFNFTFQWHAWLFMICVTVGALLVSIYISRSLFMQATADNESEPYQSLPLMLMTISSVRASAPMNVRGIRPMFVLLALLHGLRGVSAIGNEARFLEAVAKGGVIYLTKSFVLTSTVYITGQIPLTINGKGFSIRGGGSQASPSSGIQCLHFTGATTRVTVNDLTVENCNVSMIIWNGLSAFFPYLELSYFGRL